MNVAVRGRPQPEPVERPQRRPPLRKSEAIRAMPPPTPKSGQGRQQNNLSYWVWLTVFACVLAVHVAVLIGLGYLKPEPPPALESVELTFVAQGDPVPEETKAQEAQQAAMPTPPDPTPPDPTPPPPDPVPPLPDQPPPPPEEVPPPPAPMPPPPPVETPPPPVEMPPPPPLPVDDPPPPPPVKAVEEAMPIEVPPPPPVETPPPKVEPPKPVEKLKPKPKPKPHPVVKEKTEAQQASEAHKVGVAEGKAADQGMTKQTYNAILLAQIGQHKVYPEAAKAQGVTGFASVSFTMTAAGTASGISISKSSGSALLDEAARQAVRAVHTPPPPGGAFATSVGINFTLH